jgi:hypothetical protein
MRKVSYLLGAFCTILGCLSNRAFGVIVGQSAFNSSAVVEGFEAVPTAYYGVGPDYDVVTPYTFPSGVILSSPVPNLSNGTVDVVQGGFFGITAGQDVPDGIGYLGQVDPGAFSGPIQLTFPYPVYLAGAYVQDTSLETMSVLGTSGNVLESDTMQGVSLGSWATNFVAFQESQPIGSLVFTGNKSDVIRIDDVTFQVPEPSTAGLVATITILACLRRPRRVRYALALSKAALTTRGIS